MHAFVFCLCVWSVLGGTWLDGTHNNSIAPTGPTHPGARAFFASWMDATTNAFFIFGGVGYDNVPTPLLCQKNDLWSRNSNGIWKLEKGANNCPDAANATKNIGWVLGFSEAAFAYLPTKQEVFLYGGKVFLGAAFERLTISDTFPSSSSLLKIDVKNLISEEIVTPTTVGARVGAVMWYIESQDTLFLFGGITNGNRLDGDLWSHRLSDNLWSLVDQPSVRPVGRTLANIFQVGTRTFLYGGTSTTASLPGFAPSAQPPFYFDLWEFTNTWTPIYEPINVEATNFSLPPANILGRFGASLVVVGETTVALFGGFSYFQTDGASAAFNDVFVLDTENLQKNWQLKQGFVSIPNHPGNYSVLPSADVLVETGLPESRVFGSLFVQNNSVVSFGGMSIVVQIALDDTYRLVSLPPAFGLSEIEIGGIAIGGAAFIIIVSVVVIVIVIKRKNKKKLKKKSESDETTIELGTRQKSGKKSEKESETVVERERRPTSFTKNLLENVKLEEKIGEGNFGEIYRGKWHGSEVAVKKVKSKHMSETIFKEVNVLEKLNHPNLVRYLGATEIDDEIAMVFEFLAKGSLDKVLTTEHLSFQDLLWMMEDICHGMSYLHDQKVIHRDLAARNLLVTKSDDRHVVKLADFGMSKVLETENYYSEGKMIAVRWAALEAVTRAKFSTKSDTWSFGVVMWEMVTLGEIPYATLSNSEVLEYVQAGKRLKQPKQCPDDLYEVMLLCWNEDPNLRPSFPELNSKLTELQKKKNSNQKSDIQILYQTGEEVNPPDESSNVYMNQT